MSNQLFNLLGNTAPMGNMGALLTQFQHFQRTFRGDPRAQVQQMLNSGKISQEQYNQAVQTANQLMRMIR